MQTLVRRRAMPVRSLGGGGKAYDVGKVGFVNKRTSHGRMFLYRTRDKGGRLIAVMQMSAMNMVLIVSVIPDGWICWNI